MAALSSALHPWLGSSHSESFHFVFWHRDLPPGPLSWDIPQTPQPHKIHTKSIIHSRKLLSGLAHSLVTKVAQLPSRNHWTSSTSSTQPIRAGPWLPFVPKMKRSNPTWPHRALATSPTFSSPSTHLTPYAHAVACLGSSRPPEVCPLSVAPVLLLPSSFSHTHLLPTPKSADLMDIYSFFQK